MSWVGWIAPALLPALVPTVVEVEVRTADGELRTAEIVARSSAEDAPALRVTADDGSASLELEPGEWTFEADAPGFWSSTRKLAVEAVQHDGVTLSLWPTGTVAGRVRGPAGIAMPETLDLVWNASPEDEKDVPGGTGSCPIAEGRWQCVLPAGKLDLFLGAPGFIHQYLWDVTVTAGEHSELRAPLILRQGAAVRGWVVMEDRSEVEGAVVELVPRTAGKSPDEDIAARTASRKLTTEVTERGFFQIEGVPPGAWVASASKDGFSSARVSVRIREKEVTVIDNPPLTLHPPRILEIYVDPPLPPVGERWLAQLSPIDRTGGSLAASIEGVVPPGEAWRVEGISEGRYYLDLRTTSDRPEPGAGVPAWHGETLEVTADTLQVFVSVPAIAITGHLQLGKEAIQGELIFGTRHGLLRRTLVTDGAGEFGGWLPHAGLWDIDILAENPRIQTTVQMEIEADAEIEIEIPDTRVSGQVLDERGEPAPGAIVYVRDRGRRLQILGDETGAFEAAGMNSGTLYLSAAHRKKRSDVQSLVLEEGVETPEVFLIVRPSKTLTGRVIAAGSDATGPGVAGAQVAVFVVEDAFHPIPESRITDQEGRFEMTLPEHARNLLVTVAAPGFAYRAFRASSSDEPLIIPVSHEGGTITLRLPESYEPRRRGSLSVALLHGQNGVSNLIQLMRWATMQDQEIEWPTRIVAPFMEPGNYSACWVADAQYAALVAGVTIPLECVGGQLDASGELTLELGESENS